ncbi:hypothetical protein PoB_001855800 [Plakobranchus ocellatus]|uniref:Uncharacterized protein n=1 Tax=Plakobranchus ocellatus TaxID=259542 RepID=A0AAV3ZBS1_9GAST|nr:hypothetical protein PoB_001855800 [Plakobranchus ocellatus]
MKGMLPFRGMKRIRKSLKELMDRLMNDGRARYDTTAMSVTGDTVPSSWRISTGSPPVSTRGLGSFTTATQGDSTAAQIEKQDSMRLEPLEEATTYIFQYRFNHAAVYGRREDRSPEQAVRSVYSRRHYSEERSQ